MNTTANSLELRLGVRLGGAVFAAVTTLTVVSLLSQALHVERFGDGAQVVHLERVTVTAKAPVPSGRIVAASESVRAN